MVMLNLKVRMVRIPETPEILETRHQDDPLLAEGLPDPVGTHVDDPGLRMGRVGDDASL